MRYFHHMRRVLQLDETVYSELMTENLALRYCVINILLAGLAYSIAALRFSSRLIIDSANVSPGSFNSATVIMVGISVAFLMHGGGSLFVWVFSRGIGGTPFFMPSYLNIGVAGISFWPLAPALAALQTGVWGSFTLIYTIVSAGYASAVCFVAVRQASRLSNAKMGIAAVATLIYVGCFLYLWL